MYEYRTGFVEVRGSFVAPRDSYHNNVICSIRFALHHLYFYTFKLSDILLNLKISIQRI